MRAADQAGKLIPDAVQRKSGRAYVVAGGLALGLMFLGAAVAMRIHSSKEPPALSQVMPAMTVTIARPVLTSWDTTLDASGAIEPWQEAVLGAQASGLRLLEVHANVGDTVKRGQLLARFDAATLRASQAELNAGLRQAEAAARQAAANRDRSRTLKDSGGISQQEALQYETQADTSAAQVSMAQAQLESKRLQLQYAELRAPDDGVISARSATVGTVAESGRELFRLIRQGRLEWRGELTPNQLAQIAPGQKVLLQLPDGSSAHAHVRQSAPKVDTQSRLATVYADIDAGSRARAGMYAGGRVTLEQQSALIVPAASVVLRDGRSYVFKAGEGKDIAKVTAQMVRVGRRQGESVEILESNIGETDIVVQGAGFLKDGDTVHIVSAANSIRENKRTRG
jgi:RND family efflux transporter MFP subunit